MDKEKLFQKKYLFDKLKSHDENYKSDKNIYFSDHHLSHASSAFFRRHLRKQLF